MIHFRDRVGEYSGEGQGRCANGKGTKIYDFEQTYTGDWVNGRKDGKGKLICQNFIFDLKFSEGVPIKIYDSSKLVGNKTTIIELHMHLAFKNNENYYEETPQVKSYYVYIENGQIIFHGKILECFIDIKLYPKSKYYGEDPIKNVAFGQFEINSISYCGYHKKFLPDGKGILIDKTNKIQYKGNFYSGKADGLMKIKNEKLRISVNYVQGVPSGDLEFNLEGNAYCKASINNKRIYYSPSLSHNKNIISQVCLIIQAIPLIENRSIDGFEILLNVKRIHMVNNLELIGNNKPYPDTKKLIKGTYFGEEEFGMFNGKGRMLFDNGDIYCGQWKDNRIEGFGRYFYKDSSVYMGEFKANKRHGTGLMTFNNKNIYKGSWKDDLMHGKGTFKTSSFEICGIWEHNRLKSSGPSRLFSAKPIS